MASQKPTLADLQAGMVALELSMAKLDTSAILTRLEAQLTSIQADLVDVKAAMPRLAAQIAQPLTHDEVAVLLKDEPGLQLISLCSHKPSGLRPGQPFQPRAKFSHPNLMLSAIKGKHLQVARAPQAA